MKTSSRVPVRVMGTGLVMALLLVVTPMVANASQLGPVTITADTNFSPEQGLIMDTTNKIVTVVVPIEDTTDLSSVTISTTAVPGGNPLAFSTSDHFGSGAGTWTLTGVTTGTTDGSSSSVSFAVTSPLVGIATFRLKVQAVPRANFDVIDTFTVTPSNGTSRTATLRRYALEILGIAPPHTDAIVGESVDVWMSVSNHSSTNSHTLTAASTGIGGTVFSSTGTEGAMPTIPAGSGRDLIYTNATITSSRGTYTMTGDAAETTELGDIIASAPTFSKTIAVEDPTALSSVGSVSPNNSFSPAGFVMDSSGSSFTVPVTISGVGAESSALDKIRITSSEQAGGNALVFQTFGSSGSGAGGAWTPSAAGLGEITFNAPASVTPGTVTFTVAVASVPRVDADGTDTFTASYVTADGTTGGTTSAANTLKRYALEITDISRPIASAEPGATLSPVMTVVNHATIDRTLGSATTALSGTAFSSTGSQGPMPTIGAGASGTVTYSNATITSSEGTKTVEGDAQSPDVFVGAASAPHFSKNITVQTGGGEPQLGPVTISADTNFSPEQGLIMGSRDKVVTLLVPIEDTANLSSVTISTSAGPEASPLLLSSSGHMGSGAGTWSLTGVTNGATDGSSSTATFAVTSPSVGTATFTIRVSGVSTEFNDVIDTFTVTPSNGASRTATLRRYSLEITDVSPPSTTAIAGESVNVWLSVADRSWGGHTLTAEATGIGGTVFASTGTEGAMPRLNGSVTYSNATITSMTGTKTLTAEAAVKDGLGQTIASAPTFSKTVIVKSADPPPVFSSVGAVVPNNSFSPAGLVMGTSGNSLTIPVTISDTGSGAASLDQVTITSSEQAGGNALVFQTSGSSGTGAGGMWTPSSAGSGQITFEAPAGVTTGTVTFTVAVASAPRRHTDGTDSLAVSYVTTGSWTDGTTPASNTLRRYTYEIVDISPPVSSAKPRATLSPVMTVVNHSLRDVTLNTALSGTAFSSTGSRGCMPKVSEGSSGTVTYSNAIIISDRGTMTVAGEVHPNVFAGSGVATAPRFVKSITVQNGAVDDPVGDRPPAFCGVGTVTPTANSFSPAGFMMDSSVNSFTVPVTISDVGVGSSPLAKVTITSSEQAGGSALVFQTSGSSGTGAGGTWTPSSAGSGQITFDAPVGVTTGTVTFTVSVASVPRLNADGTDSFAATYVTTNATTGGTTPASNTLKRYALEIIDISPPASSAQPGSTLSPVMTVRNHALVDKTLSSALTSLSGTAFSSTGSKGAMPTIGPDATGTVTFSGATITTSISTGTKTVKGDAAGSDTSAPRFSKSVVVDGPFLNPEILFTSERDGNGEIYVMNADGTNQGNLTNHPAGDFAPDWSPDKTKIVFVSARDGNSEIYLMDADGSNLVRLTNNAVSDSMPAFSPDGTKIAFQSYRDGAADLYTMNVDGSNVWRLTYTGAGATESNPRWSPDGMKIVYQSMQGCGGVACHYLSTINADGTGWTGLAAGRNPDWSPDGTKIAFEAYDGDDWEIYTINADGSAQTNLSNAVGSDTAPAWGASAGPPPPPPPADDIARIVFRSNRLGTDRIFVMNQNGLFIINLSGNNAPEYARDFSPDGTRILVSSATTGTYQAWTMDTDGTDRFQVTTGSQEFEARAWAGSAAIVGERFVSKANRWDVLVIQRDGTGLTNLTNAKGEQFVLDASNSGRVLHSDCSGPDWLQCNIWAINADGTNARQLTSTGMEGDAQFSPDGTKIAFMSRRDANAEIYVMKADGSGQTRLTSNPASDGSQGFDWSPDGSKIAFVRDSQIYVMNADGSNQVNLSQNARLDTGPIWSPEGTKILFYRDVAEIDQIFVMSADGSNQIQVSNGTAFEYPSFWLP